MLGTPRSTTFFGQHYLAIMFSVPLMLYEHYHSTMVPTLDHDVTWCLQRFQVCLRHFDESAFPILESGARIPGFKTLTRPSVSSRI